MENAFYVQERSDKVLAYFDVLVLDEVDSDSKGLFDASARLNYSIWGEFAKILRVDTKVVNILAVELSFEFFDWKIFKSQWVLFNFMIYLKQTIVWIDCLFQIDHSLLP